MHTHTHTHSSLIRSIRNVEECKLLVSIIQLLIGNEVPPSSIGVITPYKAQERLIREELTKNIKLV